MFGLNKKSTLAVELGSRAPSKRDIIAGYRRMEYSTKWVWECRNCWTDGVTRTEAEALKKVNKHGQTCGVEVVNYEKHK